MAITQRFATENYVEATLDNYYLKSEANTLHIEILEYVDDEVAALVNSAPETLDTLGELAAAFEENQDMVETLNAAVTNKAEKTDLEDAQELISTNTDSINSIQTQVNGILELVYPKGAIYISTVATSPSVLFGFGTWERIKDTFLLSAGDAYAAGSTGGSTTHTHDVAMRFASYYNSMVMEKHEKTGIVAYDEDGTKTATGNTRIGYTGESENSLVNSGTQNGRTDIGSFGVYETVGNTSYHSSMPPYLAVYIWKRIN